MTGLENALPLRTVTLLDTAVATTNLGDNIIMDAAHQQLGDLFSESFMYRVASHDWMGSKSRSLVANAEAAITCGTNLLSSRMWLKPLWKLSPIDALANLNVTLMGAGWYQHQSSADWYTRWLLSKVLSRNTLHSVRDNYSRIMLENAGIQNVLNTGCPTLWNLTPEVCASIPQTKAPDVVTTINTYFKNSKLDGRLLSILSKHYRTIYFWIQTATDLHYASELGEAAGVKLSFLKPSMGALDDLLKSSTEVDYVGNRLHAGIRAMQHGRRTIIIEVDNRALEMGADFALPTVRRDDFSGLETMIGGSFASEVNLPVSDIERWKQQFRQIPSPSVGVQD